MPAQRETHSTVHLLLSTRVHFHSHFHELIGLIGLIGLIAWFSMPQKNPNPDRLPLRMWVVAFYVVVCDLRVAICRGCRGCRVVLYCIIENKMSLYLYISFYSHAIKDDKQRHLGSVHLDAVSHAGRKSQGRKLQRRKSRLARLRKTHLRQFAVP